MRAHRKIIGETTHEEQKTRKEGREREGERGERERDSARLSHYPEEVVE